MRKVNTKAKKNKRTTDETLSQEEFLARVKEAEKGPFRSIDSLVEDVELAWKKNSKTKLKAQVSPLGEPPSKEEFIASIREAEKGPFYELGTFEDFKKKVLSKWNEKSGK